MKKTVTNNEFVGEIHQLLKDYRDVLSFQDRVILNRKFTRKGVVSLQTQEVVNELDCNWVDVCNAIQKVIHILRVKHKWLTGEVIKLTREGKEKNARVIGWLNGQCRQNGKIATRMCALRDEEKKTDEKAKQAWRAGRAEQLDLKSR